MLLKKSTITLCSSNALSSCCCSSNPQNPKRGYHHKHRHGHDLHASNQHHQDHHIHRWPTNPHPTPYEILNHPRRAPYSKRRFNELVKLYHPDRNGHDPHETTTTGHCGIHPSHTSLSPSTKLDRYRLIILAHSILSDPARRRQYDAYGHGWTTGTDTTTPWSPDARGRYPDGKSWRQQPGNAANNATWEDWERWYAERDAEAGVAPGAAGKAEPLYMSNGLFAMFVVFATALGAIGQYTWAENYAHRMAMLKAQTHAEIMRDLREQQEREDLHRGEGEARIEAYLRRKEGAYYVPPSFK